MTATAELPVYQAAAVAAPIGRDASMVLVIGHVAHRQATAFSDSGPACGQAIVEDNPAPYRMPTTDHIGPVCSAPECFGGAA